MLNPTELQTSPLTVFSFYMIKSKLYKDCNRNETFHLREVEDFFIGKLAFLFMGKFGKLILFGTNLFVDITDSCTAEGHNPPLHS